MKEVMELDYCFLPSHHTSYIQELLELPSAPARNSQSPHAPQSLPAPVPPNVIEEITVVSPFLCPRARTLHAAILAPTPIPDSPLRLAMDLDAPLPLYAPMPATPIGVTIVHRPPTPPVVTHDSWCACSPCLTAQNELYST